jgi:hypothetical protein
LLVGVGGWWLVVGGWWLVVGGWWLVVGGWWLVVGGWWVMEVGDGGGWRRWLAEVVGGGGWRRWLAEVVGGGGWWRCEVEVVDRAGGCGKSRRRRSGVNGYRGTSSDPHHHPTPGLPSGAFIRCVSALDRSPGRKSGGAYAWLHQPVTTTSFDPRSPPTNHHHTATPPPADHHHDAHTRPRSRRSPHAGHRP